MQVFISVIQLFYIKSQEYKIANTKFQNFWQKHKLIIILVSNPKSWKILCTVSCFYSIHFWFLNIHF